MRQPRRLEAFPVQTGSRDAGSRLSLRSAGMTVEGARPGRHGGGTFALSLSSRRPRSGHPGPSVTGERAHLALGPPSPLRFGGDDKVRSGSDDSGGVSTQAGRRLARRTLRPARRHLNPRMSAVRRPSAGPLQILPKYTCGIRLRLFCIYPFFTSNSHSTPKNPNRMP